MPLAVDCMSAISYSAAKLQVKTKLGRFFSQNNEEREMKKRLSFKKEPLIIGCAFVLIGFVIGKLNPYTASTNPMVLYQYLMVDAISGIISLIGWVILFVMAMVSLVRIVFVKLKCSKCGAIAPSRTDEFCRTCGNRLF